MSKIALITLGIVSSLAYFLWPEAEKLPPPKTVDYVDLERYSGTWYEQALIPYFWERGCSNTRAIYTIKSPGVVEVDNHCVRNGKEVNNVGKATPDDATNSKLSVTFVQTLGIKGKYWIVKLGDEKDYGYVVISSPNYRYMWILSRQPVMDENLYQSLIDWMRKEGNYRWQDLVRTSRVQ